MSDNVNISDICLSISFLRYIEGYVQNARSPLDKSTLTDRRKFSECTTSCRGGERSFIDAITATRKTPAITPE